jgi:putative transposase
MQRLRPGKQMRPSETKSYRIESARLQSHDYSANGAYFVTICVEHHRCVFGTVKDSRCIHSELGEVASRFWEEAPQHHQGVEMGDFVVMPNHLHGIIWLVDRVWTHEDLRPRQKAFESPAAGSLSVVVRFFKSAVTRWANRNGHVGFKWQERFYDHVVRNKNSLDYIREYIARNPENWAYDFSNPELRTLLRSSG